MGNVDFVEDEYFWKTDICTYSYGMDKPIFWKYVLICGWLLPMYSTMYKCLFKDNIFKFWYYNGALFRIFRLIWQQLKDHRRQFKQGQKLLLIAEAMILPRWLVLFIILIVCCVCSLCWVSFHNIIVHENVLIEKKIMTKVSYNSALSIHPIWRFLT